MENIFWAAGVDIDKDHLKEMRRKFFLLVEFDFEKKFTVPSSKSQKKIETLIMN